MKFKILENMKFMKTNKREIKRMTNFSWEMSSKVIIFSTTKNDKKFHRNLTIFDPIVQSILCTNI